MLLPKRVKHRKQQRGRMAGTAKGGTSVDFGQFGLKALECGWVNNRQIEAARVAMTRYIKRGGKVWINVFPHKPVTRKAAETRMGGGKGSPESWVAVIKPGKVMFELAGVSEPVAREAMRLAAHKLPIKTKFVTREGVSLKASKLRELSDDELIVRLKDTRKELFNLRFQHATGQLDNPHKLNATRREIARLLTMQTERERVRKAAGGEA